MIQLGHMPNSQFANYFQRENFNITCHLSYTGVILLKKEQEIAHKQEVLALK